jgi:hypothetical protein
VSPQIPLTKVNYGHLSYLLHDMQKGTGPVTHHHVVNMALDADTRLKALGIKSSQRKDAQFRQTFELWPKDYASDDAPRQMRVTIRRNGTGSLTRWALAELEVRFDPPSTSHVGYLGLTASQVLKAHAVLSQQYYPLGV